MAESWLNWEVSAQCVQTDVIQPRFEATLCGGPHALWAFSGGWDVPKIVAAQNHSTTAETMMAKERAISGLV
jgi:hypothetical protein